VLKRSGLLGYASITEDAEAMAAAALQLLGLVREGKAPAQARLTVPFLTRNLE
jgi:hypothetical protein